MPDAEEVQEPRKRVEAPLLKAFHINHRDLIEHGFTESCPRCKHNQIRRSKPGINQGGAGRGRRLPEGPPLLPDL